MGGGWVGGQPSMDCKRSDQFTSLNCRGPVGKHSGAINPVDCACDLCMRVRVGYQHGTQLQDTANSQARLLRFPHERLHLPPSSAPPPHLVDGGEAHTGGGGQRLGVVLRVWTWWGRTHTRVRVRKVGPYERAKRQPTPAPTSFSPPSRHRPAVWGSMVVIRVGMAHSLRAITLPLTHSYTRRSHTQQPHAEIHTRPPASCTPGVCCS